MPIQVDILFKSGNIGQTEGRDDTEARNEIFSHFVKLKQLQWRIYYMTFNIAIIVIQCLWLSSACKQADIEWPMD